MGVTKLKQDHPMISKGLCHIASTESGGAGHRGTAALQGRNSTPFDPEHGTTNGKRNRQFIRRDHISRYAVSHA